MSAIKPTPDQIAVACEWLRFNEGDGDEGPSCHAVADWLEHVAQQDFLRSEARKAGVPVGALRKRLAAIAKAKGV